VRFFGPPGDDSWCQLYHATDYERSLDLTTGITRTVFTCGGVRQEREAFCSAPARLVCVRHAFTPGRGDVDITWAESRLAEAVLTADRDGVHEVRHAGRSITLPLRAGKPVRLEASLPAG
jgi:hypothetical protein